jgi:hypothetical protein
MRLGLVAVERRESNASTKRRERECDWCRADVVNQRKSHRHHIVPRFYLEGFVGKGRILWQYDKKDPQVVRASSPANCGVIKDYHRINDANPDAYEELLALTENAAAPVVNKANQRQRLPSDDRYALAAFVAFLKYRSPAYVESTRETQEQMMTTLLKLQQRHDDSFPSGDFKVKMDRTGVYASLGPAALNLAKFLCSMRWAFVTTDDSCPLLTSDSPVVTIDPTRRGAAMWKTTVFMSEETEMKVPISRNVALVCGHKLIRDGCYVGVSPAHVRDLNKLVAVHASRFVWADRKSPAISQLVCKYT